MNKVLVFSLGLGGYDKLFSRCVKTHKKYCKKNSYEYVMINDAPFRTVANEAAWLKIPLVLNALKNQYDWVFFIDADCEIREHMPKIETLDEQGKSIFLAKGFSERINSGVIIVKNDSASIAFFEKVLDNAKNPVPAEDEAPYENGHMIHYGKKEAAVKIIEHTWNNNSEFNSKDYVQHFSAGPLRKLYKPDFTTYKYKAEKKLKKMFGVNGAAQSNAQNRDLIESIETCMNYYVKKYTSFNIN